VVPQQVSLSTGADGYLVVLTVGVSTILMTMLVGVLAAVVVRYPARC